MSRKKRFIASLTASEIQSLKQGFQSGKSHTYRCRCKAILLSHSGWSCTDSAALFEVSLQTIYSWLDRWDFGGLSALSDKPGRGRKTILKVDKNEHAITVNKAIDRSPRNLNKALTEIERELGLSMSKKTLKRFLKKASEDGNDSADAQRKNRMQPFINAK